MSCDPHKMSSEPLANLEGVDQSASDQYLKEPFATKLRAELKKQYLWKQEGQFGADMKYLWSADVRMPTITTLTPEISNDATLRIMCNKPTFFYWALSAQTPGTIECPRMVFAEIYKAWFRCHDNNKPDIRYGRFFAYPTRITSTGPQTIPELLQAHAHIYDQSAVRMESIRSGKVSSIICKGRHWRRYNLLPLCQAIVILYDEHLPDVAHESDGTFSLDKDVERRTAVMILTGHSSGLSSPIDFDPIRSSSLPVARDDIGAIDASNVIRVPLKTAVKFIAELQQREEAASRSSKPLATDKLNGPRKHIPWEDVDNEDDFVESVLDRPYEDRSKQDHLDYALKKFEMENRGETFVSEGIVDEGFGHHWPGSWV